jgi:hypothetical protein
MIRENSSRRSSHSSMTSSRLPLVALIAATSFATVIACSSDDDGGTSTDALALEGVEPTTVPERDLPAAPAPMDMPVMPPPLPPGADTLNGLSLPDDILDWRVIGVVNVLATETAPQTLRVIVGNDIAVEAARSGQTNPWPAGSMISHYQWSAAPNPDSATTTAPDEFLRLTLMVKDTAEEFTADGNWRYGVWGGAELRPVNNPEFDRACVDCHTSRLPADSGKDYVFTVPGALPEQAAVDAADAAPNGLELPAGVLDWRVIGIASRENDMNPNIRVIVGNDIAVDAARSGDTNPWPDGAMLAHYVWAAGDNPDAMGTINPVAFNAITLMEKNAGDYAADGGWAYANWATPELTAPTDPEFDRACVNCHTDTVGPDNDYVFTRPGVLPTMP